MGILCDYWEETPERVEYYHNNHTWPKRDRDLGLRYHEMGKSWRGFHKLFCAIGGNNSFPSNFILNGAVLPNYDVEEERKNNHHYYAELPSPFLYSVEKTRMIADFLDSLDMVKLRQGFDTLVLDKYKSGYEEELDDSFFEAYQTFQKIQRFFHIVASRNHCVIGRTT